jgi:hypothetical protein
MDPARLARRFPLIARARPACPPLPERVAEVAGLARAALARTDRGALSLAASAHNKAALIASDCGLPALARALCWRQVEVYLRAQPLDAQAAQFALEPVVNLARLLIRDGDYDAAFRLLDTLFHAVRSRGEVVIDGHQLSFLAFTASADDHRALCQWLWTVLLGDGTRALVAAGRWEDAHSRAEQRGGIGRRLLDGRQVAILVRCVRGDADSARAVLHDSTLSEAWETPVASCLAALCLRFSADPVDAVGDTMVRDYLAVRCSPEFVVFRTRLGLTVLDLLDETDHAHTELVSHLLIDDAVTARNGYAARDILAHEKFAQTLSNVDRQRLSAATLAAGLDLGPLSPELAAELSAATEASEVATAQLLANSSSALGRRGQRTSP